MTVAEAVLLRYKLSGGVNRSLSTDWENALQQLVITLVLSVGLLVISPRVSAATEGEMVVEQGLLDKQPRNYSTVGTYGSKYTYSLSARSKNGKWGVLSTRYKRDGEWKDNPGRAEWLIEPEYADVFVARTRREQTHFWTRTHADGPWQTHKTNGKSLELVGEAPFHTFVTLLEGADVPFTAHHERPDAKGKNALVDYVMAFTSDPASGQSTATILDAGTNTPVLEISNLDTTKPLVYGTKSIAFPHAGATGGFTVIQPEPRKGDLQPPPIPQVVGFYIALEPGEPFSSGIDSTGRWTLLDRDFRPFQTEGLVLGRPSPLSLVPKAEAEAAMKVEATEASGERVFKIIYRGKSGNPELAPKAWKELFRDEGGYLIGQTRTGEWELLSLVFSLGTVYAMPLSFDISQREPVRAASLPLLYPKIDAWQRDLNEKRRQYAAETAAWLAAEPERRRRQLAELQKQIDEHARARAAAEAAARIAAEKAAQEFAARNKSSWGNLSPLNLPTLQGAKGLSSLEQDYYVGKGYVKVPSGTPGARFN